MLPISDKTIRSSFINASRSEAARANLPADFKDLTWENREFLAWRDPKMPQRGYLVFPDANGKVVAVMLRAPEGGARKARAVLCEICRALHAKNDVYLWVARKAGQSGRDGNTVGTLICADFQCCENVRVEPPKNEINPDPAVVVLERIEQMKERTQQFLDRVRDS